MDRQIKIDHRPFKRKHKSRKLNDSIDTWIFTIQIIFKFNTLMIDELVSIVCEYATPTLCDLLAKQFPNRFILIEPSPMNSLYGDLSAKWIVLATHYEKKKAEEARVVHDAGSASYGYDCYLSFVTLPSDKLLSETKYSFDAHEQFMNPELKYKDCRFLARRPADEDSQYLILHGPTKKLSLMGPNIGFEQNIASLDDSPATLLQALIDHGTIDVD
jgi:hypothetical protein